MVYADVEIRRVCWIIVQALSDLTPLPLLDEGRKSLWHITISFVLHW